MAVNKAKHRIWEFGHFRLDEVERLLLRDGQTVSLTPKVFDTLVALVERSGHLIEKDELMERLWPDTFVEEGALTRNISDLRKALGEEKYVETVPRRGYRFVAQTREIDDSAFLIVEKTTEAHLVIEEEEETAQVSPSQLAPAIKARPSRRSLKTRLAVMVALTVLIITGAFGLREFLKSRTSTDTPRHTFQSMQVSRFTASGNIVTAAISPDGKYVATVLDEGGLRSLWVRQVAANTSSVRLIAPALVDYWGLTFSNDSNFIYYVSWVRNQSDAELYQLPVLGGTPRRLPPPIDTPISFSPSGDRFAYVISSSSKGESAVKVADVDSGGTQTLVSRREPGFFAAWPGGPAWSPDGRSIAYAATGPVEANGQPMHVFVTVVEEKEERQLTQQSWLNVGRVAWMSDGSGLVISAREQMDAPRQLWFVSYPDGTAHKITNDLHDYDNISLTADANTLAAVQTQETFSISVTPQGETNQPIAEMSSRIEIFSEVGSGRERLSWTADNRIVYCSRAGGNWDIWLMNRDGSDQRQLTVDSHNDLFPVVSADGRFIFFASDRAGAFNIWRMGIDGSNPTQLTRGGNQTLPDITPDGQWVIYQQGVGPNEVSIWRVAVAGGEPEHLADGLAQQPAVSPDGRLLAYAGCWPMLIWTRKDGEWSLSHLTAARVERDFPFHRRSSRAFFAGRLTGSLSPLSSTKKEPRISGCNL